MPLTDQGLLLPTSETLLADVEAEQRDLIGPELETGANSPLGNVNASFVTQVREVLELIAAVFDSTDRDLATGAALARLAALTGTTKRAATSSRVAIDVTLNPSTTITAGDLVVAVAGAEDRTFVNDADIVNADPGPGDSVVSASFSSVTPGPVEADAGTITVISEPVAGVVAVTNPGPAVPGLAVETDEELRIRAEQELFRPGSSTFEAIVVDVTDALGADLRSLNLFVNDTDAVDVLGLPPHSIELLIWDGTVSPTPPLITDDEVAQALWDAKAAGIQTFGSSSGTAIDALGNERTVFFSRPTIVELYAELDLDVTVGWQGTPDEDAAKNRVVEFGNGLEPGEDVILSQLVAFVLRGDSTPEQGFESRIIDVVRAEVDDVTPTVAITNYDVDIRELAVFDVARVTVALV